MKKKKAAKAKAVAPPAGPTPVEQEALRVQANTEAQKKADAEKAAGKVLVASDLSGKTVTDVTVWKLASIDIVEVGHADGPTFIKFRHGLCEVGGDMTWGTGEPAFEASAPPAEKLARRAGAAKVPVSSVSPFSPKPAAKAKAKKKKAAPRAKAAPKAKA
jgi:hypothetical protein